MEHNWLFSAAYFSNRGESTPQPEKQSRANQPAVAG